MSDSAPLRDIENRADLDRLILRFYQKLMVDPTIGHFFNAVVPLDLDHHIPHIASFWESILFQTGDFAGEPMQKHIALHHKSPMEAAHFQVWLGHFSNTVDKMFFGNLAELAKQRAYSIAMLMQVKIKREAL